MWEPRIPSCAPRYRTPEDDLRGEWSGRQEMEWNKPVREHCMETGNLPGRFW